MNLDFIKTKKAMIEFATENNVHLNSSTLKGMKEEYYQSTKTSSDLLSLLQAETHAGSTITPIQGDTNNVVIRLHGKHVETISMAALAEYCQVINVRHIDAQSVLDHPVANIMGYTFKREG